MHLKEKLTQARRGCKNTFGYGSVMVSFPLEYILDIRPITDYDDDPSPIEPHMTIWTFLMER